MLIANKLKKTNRAEYLLYMWQVEDVIRAYGVDEERIAKEYVSRFTANEKDLKEMAQWYADLCEMMRSEGKSKAGHLQICKNVLQELEELHNQLVKSTKFPYYREMYYKVLPFIVELRTKGQKETPDNSELDICFSFLYGVMMLRLQHKPISDETEKAVKAISTLLGQLSDYYFKDKQEPIDFEE